MLYYVTAHNVLNQRLALSPVQVFHYTGRWLRFARVCLVFVPCVPLRVVGHMSFCLPHYMGHVVMVFGNVKGHVWNRGIYCSAYVRKIVC